jgi:hypothetical protein
LEKLRELLTQREPEPCPSGGLSSVGLPTVTTSLIVVNYPECVTTECG